MRCLTRPRNMSCPIRWILPATALIVGMSGCRKASPPPPPPPIVQVITVTTTNVARSAIFIGQLDSPQNVEVRARVEAFVDKMLFTEGSHVVEGQELFALDKKPYEQRLAAAQGVLAEANAALDKYKTDVKRLEPLAEKKAIPQQDLDNARASVAVGEASVESAVARVATAELDLSYCDVTAPISGLIGAKQVSIGDLVGKGQPTLLATISQLDPIWFYCSISEVEYLQAQRAAMGHGREIGELPVTLLLADGTEHPTPGKWVFIDRAVDVTTGTIRARAEFSNTQKLLRPGMFARVRISLRTEEGSILVPERALSELQGRDFVWVIGADNKATRRPVKTSTQKFAEKVVISEGLKAGERVVVEGLQKVREGGLVQPMTAQEMIAVLQATRQSPAESGKATGDKSNRE